jgi:hypothetical protein
MTKRKLHDFQQKQILPFSSQKPANINDVFKDKIIDLAARMVSYLVDRPSEAIHISMLDQKTLGKFAVLYECPSVNGRPFLCHIPIPDKTNVWIRVEHSKSIEWDCMPAEIVALYRQIKSWLSVKGRCNPFYHKNLKLFKSKLSGLWLHTWFDFPSREERIKTVIQLYNQDKFPTHIGREIIDVMTEY